MPHRLWSHPGCCRNCQCVPSPAMHAAHAVFGPSCIVGFHLGLLQHLWKPLGASAEACAKGFTGQMDCAHACMHVHGWLYICTIVYLRFPGPGCCFVHPCYCNSLPGTDCIISSDRRCVLPLPLAKIHCVYAIWSVMNLDRCDLSSLMFFKC